MAGSGCGGVVIYDPVSSLRYRQHTANLIGANTGFWNRLVGLYRYSSAFSSMTA